MSLVAVVLLAGSTVVAQAAPSPASAPPSPAPVPAASPAATSDPTAYHVVSLRPGPSWRKDLHVRQQPGIREHGLYMSQLSGEGVIVLGGPFLEDVGAGTVSGAMVVLATADAAEARRRMENDPGVRSGLFEIVEVKRFMAATGAWRPWSKAQP
jgi:uncharacterized protein YciI